MTVVAASMAVETAVAIAVDFKPGPLDAAQARLG